MPKSLIEQITSKCIYFAGVQHVKCEKGINIRKLDAKVRLPYRIGLPCLTLNASQKTELEKLGKEQAKCEYQEFPSKEAARTKEKELHGIIKEILAGDKTHGFVCKR